MQCMGIKFSVTSLVTILKHFKNWKSVLYWGYWSDLSVPGKLNHRLRRTKEGWCYCMSSEEPACSLSPLSFPFAFNLLICLICSGLLSRRKKKKKKEKKFKEKGDRQRMFPRHQDPKSGHNFCCHKFSMCPLRHNLFILHSILTPAAIKLSFLF